MEIILEMQSIIIPLKQSLTTVSDILHFLVGLVSHKSQQREDCKTGKHTGTTVDEGDNHRVPPTVVVELVEAGHTQQTSEGWT